MNRLPDSRRRIFGVSVFAILVVIAVLWVLRKVPPASQERKAPPEGDASPGLKR